jgi:hypothetical protein
MKPRAAATTAALFPFWSTVMTATIRALNDELRRNLDRGIVVITPGVAAMGQDVVQIIFRTITTYDAFTRKIIPTRKIISVTLNSRADAFSGKSIITTRL